jgi:hypothetical protein
MPRLRSTRRQFQLPFEYIYLFINWLIRLNVVVCEPVQITWTGGTGLFPPIFLSSRLVTRPSFQRLTSLYAWLSLLKL